MESPPQRTVAGILAASTAVTTWGGTSVVVVSIEGTSGIGIAFHRLWIGTIPLVIALYVTGSRLSVKLLRASFSSGVAFVADVAMFFSALRLTSVANATMIGALQPVVLLPISARYFGERHPRSTLLWSAMAVAGTLVVIAAGEDSGTSHLKGDLLAAGALFSWTWYFVASKRARRTLGAVEHFTGVSLVAAVLMVPLGLALRADLSPAGAEAWALIAVLAVLAGGVGHTLLSWSHGHVPLQVASLITLLVPVAAAVAAKVFLDQSLNAVQVAGMVLVIASLFEIVRQTARSAKIQEAPGGAVPAAA